MAELDLLLSPNTKQRNTKQTKTRAGNRRDEFTRFMFLERAQHAGNESNADNWRLFPQVCLLRDGSVCASNKLLYAAKLEPAHTKNNPPLKTKTTTKQPKQKEFRDRNEPSSRHRDRVDRVVHVPQADKYVTCGRDGSVR
jgi:hypothetical protein